MTTVINLFGGPGVGKSAMARLLSAKLSYMGHTTELVTEYCKDWSYQGIKPSSFDQLYFFAKQVRSESIKYNKVDYIVTDSPIMLSAIYERYYTNDSIIEPSMFKFFDECAKQDIRHVNYVIRRALQYNPIGRYQSEVEAIKIDNLVLDYLIDNQVEFMSLADNSEEICSQLISELLVGDQLV